MADRPSGKTFESLAALNAALLQADPLIAGAGRVVPGEGPVHAAIAFVGEQPGDAEDLAGRPFVGPAGQLLAAALEEAGIARRDCYVTNAVKQFIFSERGKRRLHKRPSAGEIAHYRWWLEQEIRLADPGLVVALGATALFALTGKREPVTAARGPATLMGRPGYVTVHPSSLLRIPLPEDRRVARRAFMADLRAIGTIVAARA